MLPNHFLQHMFRSMCNSTNGPIIAAERYYPVAQQLGQGCCDITARIAHPMPKHERSKWGGMVLHHGNF